MTTRGRAPGNQRPITPPDPSLATRPVPRTRAYTPHSYGPGAAPNIRSLVRNLEDVQAESNPATYLNPIDAQYAPVLSDGIHRLLEEVIRDSQTAIDDENGQILPVEPGPTWGFYAFVVDYDADTISKIPGAMQNLVEVTRRNIRAQTTSSYADEALKRFKVDVVMDEAALVDASTDRIREEFRAQLRGENLLGDDNLIRGGARNYACLVLDRPTVTMLADLSLAHAIASLEDAMQEWLVLRGKTIRLVDAWWERPSTNVSAYRGVDQCPITHLAYFYKEVSTGSNSGSIQELWPLKKPLRGLGA